MPSFNRVVLIGRLTRDPELRYTAGGLAVTTFSIAVDRRFKNQQTGERQTDFFRCKAWRQKAEFVANYLGKGRLVCVEGSVEINEVVGQDGQKRYFTDIVCDNVEGLDSPRDTAAQADGEFAGAAAPPADHEAAHYQPDEEPAAPAAVSQAAARPAQRPAVAAARPAAQAATRAASGPAAAGAAPARPAQPAYPAEDDYDDSDPFADE